MGEVYNRLPGYTSVKMDLPDTKDSVAVNLRTFCMKSGPLTLILHVAVTILLMPKN